MNLDTIRDITRPWYEWAPTSITLAFIVVMVLVSYVVFQFLFVIPAKKTDTSGPTTLNFNGNNIQHLSVAVAATQGVVPPPPSVEGIVENGGFEQGVDGWGTGFFEGLFLRTGDLALGFNNAVANCSVEDQRSRSGRRALRVRHESAYSPNVFSSLSQRIKVKPSRRYEVRFWAYLEISDRGGFSLRVLPSRRTQSNEWDRFKGKLDPTVLDRWQEVRIEFESGADAFFDLRFAAEAPLKVWVDDVSVISLDSAKAD